MNAAVAAPLRIKLNATPITDGEVYKGSEVEVSCGGQPVAGVVAVGISIEPGEIAQISLVVHAILEVSPHESP